MFKSNIEKMQSIPIFLIKAERNKESDYKAVLSDEGINREIKNLFEEHRTEAEKI